MSIVHALSEHQRRAFLDPTWPASKATVNSLVVRGLLSGRRTYTDNGRWVLFSHQNRKGTGDFQPGDPVVYMSEVGVGGWPAIRPIRSAVARTTAQYVVLEDWPGRVGSLHIGAHKLAHLADVEAEGLPIDGFDPAASFGGHALVNGTGRDAQAGEDEALDDEPEWDDGFEPYPDPEPRPEPFIYPTGERAEVGDKVRVMSGVLPATYKAAQAVGVIKRLVQPGNSHSGLVTVEWQVSGAEPFTEFTADRLKLVERAHPDKPLIVELGLGHISRDPRFQPRAAMNQDVIEEYAEAMREGAQFPPVLVYRTADPGYGGQGDYLVDGFHRYAAAVRAGRETLLAEVHTGTSEDAQWASLAANATHGLRRSRADLQRAIELALTHPSSSALSDRELARHVGCDHKTVGARRHAMKQSGAIATNYPPASQASGEIPHPAAGRAAQLGPDDLRSIDEAAALAPYYATYRELVAAHPGRLVLMKHSLWYMAWDESVEPIKTVLGRRAPAGTDQILHRPCVSVSYVAGQNYLALLTQAYFSLAVMERDGSVRLIEPDGAVMAESADEPEETTQEPEPSFAAEGRARERDDALNGADAGEWRDARVLCVRSDRSVIGLVMKLARHEYGAVAGDQHRTFSSHQLAAEWVRYQCGLAGPIRQPAQDKEAQS